MDMSSAAESPRKRCIIGVIGGDESHQALAAKRVGEAIARAGQIVLTGGRPEPGNEVKNAVLWGALEAEQTSTADSPVKARMIGILKGGTPDWRMPSPCRLFLETGLSSFGRDPINGLTPDALIVFSGGRGTLCELAYAAVASKPLAFYGSVAQLSAKTQEHILNGKLKGVLEEALKHYSHVSGERLTPETLIAALNGVLKDAKPAKSDPNELVNELANQVLRQGTLLPRTGFPGLNGNTQEFEVSIRKMEDCE